MDNLKKKLGSSLGESITETLVALLIVVLALTMLAGALVSTAKVNKNTDRLDTVFKLSKAEKVTGGTVTIYRKTESPDKKEPSNAVSVSGVTCYRTDDDNGYCYYSTK